MGHQRLGPIPKSKAFSKIIEMVTGFPSAGNVRGGSGAGAGSGGGGGAGDVSILEDVEAIAAATLEAASGGLEEIARDEGLTDVFYLMTQLVLAARDAEGWRERFSELGISLRDDSGMFEFTSELRYAIQDRFDDRCVYTDVAEMARKSAIDAIQSLASDKATTLFGSGPDELRDAIRELSTKKGFAKLGRSFFAGFLSQYLNFYLCKETPNAVREGRLDGMEGIRQFENALDRHCHESAKVVEEFCGTWYTKKEWQEGITPENAADAAAYAVSKLQKELEKQGGGE